MKKWILITAVVMFAAGLILGGAYVAVAQGNTPPTPFSSPGGWMGRGMMGYYNQSFTGTVPFGPGGMMRGRGYSQPFTGTEPFGSGIMMAPGGIHEQVWTAVAQELGLTYEQLQTELGTKTLAQLAQEKNIKLDKLQETGQAAWKAGINKLVEEGKLTREQADWMIERMGTADLQMFGQGRGLGPCHDDDDNSGPQGRGNAPQGFGFGGGRGHGSGMMGHWTW
jgi:hypothetical protein